MQAPQSGRDRETGLAADGCMTQQMLATPLQHVRCQNSSIPIIQRHQIFVSRGSPRVTVILGTTVIWSMPRQAGPWLINPARFALSESASQLAIGMGCVRLELTSLARDRGNEYAEVIVEYSRNQSHLHKWYDSEMESQNAGSNAGACCGCFSVRSAC